MKEIVSCSKCSKCAVGYEIGFTGRKVMLCSLLDCKTTEDDGCTFGSEGEQLKICDCTSVNLGGHETVYGWHW